MKKIKLIYNPASGDKSFKDSLDPCIKAFQHAGYETHVFRSAKNGDMAAHIKKMPRDYAAVAIAGGDGTLNITVNALMDASLDIPICLIPSGTANDFASFLKLPKDPEKAAKVIADNNIISCDVGSANGRYFVNVLAAGLLANVSQKIDADLKDLFGKLAYYMEGLGQIGGFKPLSVRIENSMTVIEEDIYFFLILNSSGTGGFDGLVKDASINDGLFDFIAVKARPLAQMAVLLVKVLSRDFLNDPNIIYFRDSYIKIDPLFENETFLRIDTDGENGGKLPAEVRNIHNAIKIFVPA